MMWSALASLNGIGWKLLPVCFCIFWVPLVVLDQCVAPGTKAQDTGRVRPEAPRSGSYSEPIPKSLLLDST